MATTSYDSAELPSLKLTAPEARRVIDSLNRQQGPAKAGRKRRARLAFEKSNVVIEFDDGSGRSVRHRVVSRNLSTHGIAVIHGQFMHVHRPCTVEIPLLEAGKMFRVNGRVERCKLVSGRVHEIAIVFDTSIDLSLFVGMDSVTEMKLRSEAQGDARDPGRQAVTTPALQVGGSALVIEPFESSRKLYVFWLGKVGLQVTEATDSTSALQTASGRNFNLVLIDLHLGENQGIETIRALRSSGVTGLVIAMSAGPDEALRSASLSAGADVCLLKPFDRVILERTLQNNLALIQGNAEIEESIQSTLHDPEMKPLVEDFVVRLPELAENVVFTANAGNIRELRLLAVELSESAKGYGFAPLHAALSEVLGLCAAPESNLLPIRRKCEVLARLMRRCAA